MYLIKIVVYSGSESCGSIDGMKGLLEAGLVVFRIGVCHKG